jgi:hypothetical protein
LRKALEIEAPGLSPCEPQREYREVCHIWDLETIKIDRGDEQRCGG